MNTRQIVLVYQSDEHHSRASKVLMAACTSKGTAILKIQKFVKDKYSGKLTEDDLYNLEHINQTQSNSENDSFEGEFILEIINLNEILGRP